MTIELEDLINRISSGKEESTCLFPFVESTECLGGKFKRQASDIDGVEFEYFWQGYDGLYGQRAIPYGSHGTLCLVFDFID